MGSNVMHERDLDRHLIGHREETVRIESIDLVTGGRYGLQNREESEVPEDVMDDYTAAWLRDDPFPPVILWQDGSRYMPIDGYTRCASALRAGKEEIPALIADCDESTARQLCIEANARHGRRASRDFLIRGAVGLVEEGMSVREAAARTALPESVVAERRLVAKAQSRARQNHVSGVDRLPDSVLEKVANIDLDSVFKELLELARDAKLKPTKVADIAKSVRQARSEADQLAIIQGERVEAGATAADDQAAQIAQPFTRFVSALTKLRSFDLSEIVKAAYSSGKSVEEVRDQSNRVHEMASGLDGVIEDVYGDAHA
jgi:ParB-like chromosome segregation protein Spo0J